ncbi:MAG: flavodoxin [Methanomicrobiales archaeon]|nr:flavodoxin [Methanomicrobiales archaeon]
MAGRKILVAYASRYGSTREIAEAIAEVLRERDMEVDVANVVEISRIAGYDGIVIGSPIYMGKWLVEAVDFVKLFQSDLHKMAVAVFAVGFSMRDPTPDNRRNAVAAIQAIRPYVHPLDVGIFAGRLVLSELSVPDRQIVAMSASAEGDFRDWDEIASWAGELETILSPPA